MSSGASISGARKSPFSYTIQSNASLSTYPNNKENNFKVHLSTPIELESGDWVVGLSEIHYRCDFKPHIDLTMSSKPPGSEKLIEVPDDNDDFEYEVQEHNDDFEYEV